jgi:hypothetical protein
MPVRFNTPAIVERVRRGAWQGVVTGVGIVESRAVRLILGPPKSGRIYRRRGVEHQASAPGEAPANDSSRLVNSRQIILIPERLRAKLVFSAKHALWMEHGTRRIQPRPFARRSLVESKNAVVNAISAGVASELHR